MNATMIFMQEAWKTKEISKKMTQFQVQKTGENIPSLKRKKNSGIEIGIISSSEK